MAAQRRAPASAQRRPAKANPQDGAPADRAGPLRAVDPREAPPVDKVSAAAEDPSDDIDLTDADRVFLDYVATVAVRLWLLKRHERK